MRACIYRFSARASRWSDPFQPEQLDRLLILMSEIQAQAALLKVKNVFAFEAPSFVQRDPILRTFIIPEPKP